MPRSGLDRWSISCCQAVYWAILLLSSILSYPIARQYTELSSCQAVYWAILLLGSILSYPVARQCTELSCCQAVNWAILLPGSILSYPVARQYTELSCCQAVYWAILLPGSILSYPVARQYTELSCCQAVYWAIMLPGSILSYPVVRQYIDISRPIRNSTWGWIWIYLVQKPVRKHSDFRKIRDEYVPRYNFYGSFLQDSDRVKRAERIPQVPSSTALWVVCPQVVTIATVETTSGDKGLAGRELSRYCVPKKWFHDKILQQSTRWENNVTDRLYDNPYK
jgi:hypothetical protein